MQIIKWLIFWAMTCSVSLNAYSVTTGVENWSALSSGVNGDVFALAKDNNGNVYVGGSLTSAGPAAYIAKWNGSSWSALGAGVNGGVSALTVDGNGNVYAAGSFTVAGGVSANRIAKWNGSSWSALGAGISGVTSLAADSNGNLYAGGYFSSAGGVPANNIAKWNGSTWSALGSGANNQVQALAFDSDGNLYVGGYFSGAGGVPGTSRIAKWNGTTWSSLNSGIYVPAAMHGVVVNALAVDTNNNVYIGGAFNTTAGGVRVYDTAKWNGSVWSAVTGATYVQTVYALAVDNVGNLYIGGTFGYLDHIAKWNGTNLSSLGTGMNNYVRTLLLDNAGKLYVGGQFTAVATKPAYIAAWSIIDTDNDRWQDYEDVFPSNAAEWLDTDNDGIGNNSDGDDDGDGVPDVVDAYPLNSTSRTEIKLPFNGVLKGSSINESVLAQ